MPDPLSNPRAAAIAKDFAAHPARAPVSKQSASCFETPREPKLRPLRSAPVRHLRALPRWYLPRAPREVLDESVVLRRTYALAPYAARGRLRAVRVVASRREPI